MSCSKRIRLTRTKKSYACFFCNKIINRPVKLPCDASICYEHIKHLRESVFHCQSCQREHVVPEKGFEYNDELQEQIDTDIYLTKSECEQKKAINELLKNIGDSFDDFNLKFNEFEYFNHEHFASIEADIELRRERLKIQIDELSDEMIKRAKKKRAKFVEKSKQITIDAIKSGVDEEKQHVLETFRHLDLSIKTINELKAKQSNHLKEILDKIEMFNTLKEEVKNVWFGAATDLTRKHFGDFINKLDFLVRVSDRGTCEIWNLETNKHVKTFKVNNNFPVTTSFKVVNKNKLIVSYSNGMFGTYDLRSEESLQYFGVDGSDNESFDGIFANSTHIIKIHEKDIYFFNHETGCLKKRLKIKEDIDDWHICYLFENNNILCYDYSDTENTTMKLIDYKTGKVLTYDNQGNSIETFKVLSNEQTFATGTKGEIRIWNMQGKCIRTLNLKRHELALYLEFNAENKLMCVISSPYCVEYHDDSSDEESSSDSENSFFSDSDISNQYRYIKIWDMANDYEMITCIELENGVDEIKTLSTDKTITIHDDAEKFVILRTWQSNSIKTFKHLNTIKLSRYELNEDDVLMSRFDEHFSLCSFFD